MGVITLPEREVIVDLLMARWARDNRYQFKKRDRKWLLLMPHRMLYVLAMESGNADLYPPGIDWRGLDGRR